MTLFLYTDGSSRPTTREGGWACIAVKDGKEAWRISGAAVDTTNNRMELMAIYQGLARALQADVPDNVIVITDSQYCIGAIDKGHRVNINGDLITPARSLLRSFPRRPKFEWIKGHSGHEWNDKVDLAARHARDGFKVRKPPLKA